MRHCIHCFILRPPNSLEYSNPDCLIVTVNGNRARTAAGAEYYADGSTEYLLPQRLGFSQSIIADPEVHVYINDPLAVIYCVTGALQL